ncbi:MAG: glutathione S-transferase [Gammaproteobacteria bacterium]|nr:glutathione S-transferase [Gammaproteobacteria bacterium]
MITLWGRRNSMNVQKVTWALKELDLGYERHNVGGSFGGTGTDDYLAMNPNRVVPTLRDGDVTIWESNAIVRYLARTYGVGRLQPKDAPEHARAEQWMDWLTSTLNPPFFQVFFNTIRLAPDQQNADAIAAGVDGCARLYGQLDAHLATQPYLAGQHFSMGDIPVGVTLYRYFNMDIERPALPNVTAWYERLQERPAYRRAVMIPFGRNVQEWDELETAGADQPD